MMEPFDIQNMNIAVCLTKDECDDMLPLHFPQSVHQLCTMPYGRTAGMKFDPLHSLNEPMNCNLSFVKKTLFCLRVPKVVCYSAGKIDMPVTC